MISNNFMIVAPSLEMVTPCKHMAVAAKTGDTCNAASESDWQVCYPLGVYELVHATWPKCCSDSINNSHTCVDVADELCFSLTGICAFLKQDDLWLL